MGATRRILLILAISGLCIFPDARAQPAGTVMSVESLEGEVQTGGAPIFRGQRLRPGTRLTTRAGSMLVLRFDDGMHVVLGEQTIFIPVDFRSERAVFDLLSGAARVRTGEVARANPRQFFFRTTHAQFGVEGPADFSVVVSDAAYVNVASGTVVAANAAGTSRISAGSTAQVRNSGTAAGAVAPASVPGQVSSAFRTLDFPMLGAAEAAPAAAAAPAPSPRPISEAPGRFWAGASVGRSGFDEKIVSRLISSGEVDTEATGFKLFAGYRFHPNFGVEVGYADLGKTSYSGTFNGMPVTDGKLQVGGLDAALLGTLPLGDRLSLFAKAGIFFWEAQANDTAGGVPFSTTTDGQDSLLGGGLSYRLTAGSAVRAELEVRKAAGATHNLLSVGFEVRF